MAIMKCNGCTNRKPNSQGGQWQNEVYGYNMRVFNKMKDGQYRCTVCGNIVGSPKGKSNI